MNLGLLALDLAYDHLLGHGLHEHLHSVQAACGVSLSWHAQKCLCRILTGAAVYVPRLLFGSEARAKAMYKYHRYVPWRITHATRLFGYALGTLILLELLLAIWEVRWVQTATQLPHRVLATGLVLALGFGVFRHVDAAKLGW